MRLLAPESLETITPRISLCPTQSVASMASYNNLSEILGVSPWQLSKIAGVESHLVHNRVNSPANIGDILRELRFGHDEMISAILV